MLPQLRLKTLFLFVACVALGVTTWVQNSSSFGWTIVCEWHSFAPTPGYSEALGNYRAWLVKNSFQECDSPNIGVDEVQYTDTQWFQSDEYPEIFVLTSGDHQNVIANVVVQVEDPMFMFLGKATQSELKQYSEFVSRQLNGLGHPMLDRP